MIRLKNCSNMYTSYGLCYLSKDISGEGRWFDEQIFWEITSSLRARRKHFVLNLVLEKACTYNGYKFWGGHPGAFMSHRNNGSVYRSEGELILRAKLWV